MSAECGFVNRFFRRDALLWQNTLYTPLLFLTAAISLAVAGYAVRHRGTPGAWAMTAMMVGAAVWSAGYALEIGSVRLSDKVFWAKVQYVGICLVPFSALAFGVRYSGRDLRPALWAALGALPGVVLALVFTNERHGLVWARVGLSGTDPFLEITHGPAFWVYWMYSYALIVVGLALIASVLFSYRRLYLKQSAIIVFGLLAPWLGNTLYVLDILPGNSSFDFTPVGFTATGILLAWGLFRFRLLDLVPVAHHRIVESVSDGVLVLDARGRVLDLNPAATPLLAVPPASAVGRRAGEIIVGWSDIPGRVHTKQEVRLGDPPRDYELTVAPLGERAEDRENRKPGEEGLVVIFRDIEARKRAEREVRESEERYRRLVELSPDAILVHSPGGIDYINEAGARTLGASRAGELIGRSIVDFVHPSHAKRMEERLGRTYREKEYTSAAEEKFVRLDGRVMDVETTVMPITHSGRPAAQVVFREITARKAAEEALAHRAFHDSLTGLPNRTLFKKRLEEALGSGGAAQVGVLFIDLDGFKLVNDSLGHESGDALLEAVAGRLVSCVRPGDVVARIGGDEFTVLLAEVSGVEEAAAVAGRISGALSGAFEINGEKVPVTASIGIALGERGAYATNELLRDADAAMYEAKREGGTRYRFFREGAGDLALRDLEMKNALRRALTHEELTVLYQPKVSLKTGEIAGLEALLRWRHPEWGLLRPHRFMAVAEESGLMPEIGVYVLGEVFRRSVEWLGELPGSFPLTIGVNLSVRQVRQPEVAERILSMLEKSGLSPENLELDVTEGAFLERDGPAVSALIRLREAGIKLSVDDFGTGYSSLSRIGLVPVDAIKIDESLISVMNRSPDDLRVVRAVVDLAHALGKTAVAEGVETPAQLQQLRALGCDFAQGNYLFEPLEADEALKTLLSCAEARAPEPTPG